MADYACGDRDKQFNILAKKLVDGVSSCLKEGDGEDSVVVVFDPTALGKR